MAVGSGNVAAKRTGVENKRNSKRSGLRSSIDRVSSSSSITGKNTDDKIASTRKSSSSAKGRSKASEKQSKDSSSSSKMSKIGYSLGLTAAVGVALVGVCLFQTESTFEDVGEQIALKLIEILPRKHHAEFQPSSKPVTDNRTEQRNRQPETKTSTAAAAASKASSSA